MCDTVQNNYDINLAHNAFVTFQDKVRAPCAYNERKWSQLFGYNAGLISVWEQSLWQTGLQSYPQNIYTSHEFNASSGGLIIVHTWNRDIAINVPEDAQAPMKPCNQ